MLRIFGSAADARKSGPIISVNITSQAGEMARSVYLALWRGIFDRLSQIRGEDGILFVAADGRKDRCKINAQLVNGGI